MADEFSSLTIVHLLATVHHGGAERVVLELARRQRSLGANVMVLCLQQLGERGDQLRVLGTMAELQQEMGAFAEAEAHLTRLIAACTSAEDQPERFRSLHGMGTVLARRGAQVEAMKHFREALAGFTDQPALRARILHQMGQCAMKLNEAKTALEYLQESLAIYQELNDDKARARLLVDVGNAQVLLGNKDDAVDLFEEAADLCEDQGDLRATTIIRKATKGLNS